MEDPRVNVNLLVNYDNMMMPYAVVTFKVLLNTCNERWHHMESIHVHPYLFRLIQRKQADQ